MSYFSMNPTFVNIDFVPPILDIFYDGNMQSSWEVMARFLYKEGSVAIAKEGYGVGYTRNILWKHSNVPYTNPYMTIPWGKAVLCRAKKEPPMPNHQNYKLLLTPLSYDEINGNCYNISIKDNSIQLSCGISVGSFGSIDEDEFLILAVFANMRLSHGEVILGDGDTIVAVSEAIDKSVFNAPNNYPYYLIDTSVGNLGVSFTIRANLALSNKIPSVYTSYHDNALNMSPNILVDGINSEE